MAVNLNFIPPELLMDELHRQRMIQQQAAQAMAQHNPFANSLGHQLGHLGLQQQAAAQYQPYSPPPENGGNIKRADQTVPDSELLLLLEEENDQ